MKRIEPLKQDRMPAPHIRCDRTAAAAYITLSDKAVAKTDQVHRDLLVDVDSGGELVGVEIFGTVFIDLMEQVVGERDRRPIDGRAPEAY